MNRKLGVFRLFVVVLLMGVSNIGFTKSNVAQSNGLVAIVLSGGGAKGDFQVGALRYLYDQGIRPDILTGTSVGAITAAKLAEGENPDDPSQGLKGLETLWAGLRTNSDMYLEEDWLNEIHPELKKLIIGQAYKFDEPRDFVWEEGPFGWAWSVIDNASYLLTDGKDILKSFKTISDKAISIYNLNPVEEKMKQDLDITKVKAWVAQGHKLRLAMVDLETGELKYFTEEGKLVDRDGNPYRVTKLDNLSPECKEIQNRLQNLLSNLRGLRKSPNLAREDQRDTIAEEAQNEESQIRQLWQEWAKCVQTYGHLEDAQIGLSSETLRKAVMASASIPAAFPPVCGAPLGDCYVDGGVREIMPVEITIKLQAKTIYAISASPDTHPINHLPYHPRLSTIGSRSISAMLSETTYNDIPKSLPPNVRLIKIQPDFEVHDTFTIDPGLIQINRDYGYMRASDVLDQVEAASKRWQLANDIALLRVAIWHSENFSNCKYDPISPYYTNSECPKPPNTSYQMPIELKKQLQKLVEERRSLGGPVPNDINRWFSSFELHSWWVTTNPQVDDAEYVNWSIPTAMTVNVPSQISITMHNTGTTIWATGSYKLGLVLPHQIYIDDYYPLPHIVKPGDQVTVTFTITPKMPGNYPFQWRMYRSPSGGWFGQSTPQVMVEMSTGRSDECKTLKNLREANEDQLKVLQGEFRKTHSPYIGDEIARVINDLRAIDKRMSELKCP